MSDTLIFYDFRTVNNFDVCICNEIGKRDEQQDCIYVSVNNNSVFSVLCDGMGGMDFGRMASMESVRLFVDYCRQYKEHDELWMQTALEAVNGTVSNFTVDNKQLLCGSTLVSIFIDESSLQWISVGDSRLYIYRNNELIQVTTDHTYFNILNQKLEADEISEHEYVTESEKGEQLTSYIGLGGLNLIDISQEPLQLQVNDLIMICSDGVHKTLDDTSICKIFNDSKTVEQIGNAIIAEIDKYNYSFQDNYSFALIQKLA